MRSEIVEKGSRMNQKKKNKPCYERDCTWAEREGDAGETASGENTVSPVPDEAAAPERQAGGFQGDMKPYEKFLALGPEALTEAELLAIIIRTGTKAMDSLGLARRILALPKGQEKGLLGLRYLSVRDLCQIPGIGEVKAVKIKCLTELSRRLAMADRRGRLQFTRPETVADYYMERMRYQQTEEVILAMTDNRNSLICDRVLSMGTVNASMVSPREVFLTALEYRAVHILLIHNHPSGDPTPSRQDIEITERLAGLCGLMQIPLLDHVIVGEGCYVSFREAGLLK